MPLSARVVLSMIFSRRYLIVALSLTVVQSATISAHLCFAKPVEKNNSQSGDHYLANGQYAEAVDLFTKEIARNPTYVLYEGRAVAYEHLGKWQEAADDYSVELKMKPRHAAAFAGRAQANMNLSHVQQAIKDITQAIAIAPCSYYYLLRAEFFEKAGDHDRAKADHDKLEQVRAAEIRTEIERCTTELDKHPDQAGWYISRGIARYSDNQYAQAIEDLNAGFDRLKAQAASSSRPRLPVFYDSAYALFCRGKAYAALGKYGQAVDDYSKVIADTEVCILPADPDDVLRRRLPIEERLARAEAYLALKRLTDAIIDYTEVISTLTSNNDVGTGNQIDPRLKTAYAGRAKVYKLQGKAELAEQDLAKLK